MSEVHAVLIGVAAPAPVRWSDNDGRFVTATEPYQDGDFRFAALEGVSTDLASYTNMVIDAAPDAVISRLESPEDTTLAAVTAELERHVRREIPCTCTSLVIVLVGHGFQVQTWDPEEPDRMDELFALSDLPLIDDWWVPFWREARRDLTATIVVDSCHSETIVRGLFVPDPVIVRERVNDGPRRLIISASMDAQLAYEHSMGGQTQGVLTHGLELAWALPDNRTSYEAWFASASSIVNRTILQTAVMRIIDPEQTVQLVPPFTAGAPAG
ncbi:caspase family protein [Microbacterium trichothecenolyticum]|uniref:Caspase domain protein n=1 Tax=Microbacterium trichothecenolyticum TaxID=69370 RepID=A0A0M2H350_MICTR|nr:caspase family protein [Microbacterium trichothecenolyticum]KJL40812.1 Caspase domain protein [Microbacterium trichothecenolyticum]